MNRPEVGKGPFQRAGVDAGLKTSHAPPTEKKVNSSVIATQISDVPLRFMTKKYFSSFSIFLELIHSFIHSFIYLFAP